MNNEPYSAYLFAHFTGVETTAADRSAANEQIYFAVSRDARTWHDLRRQGHPIFTSRVGDRGMRDPYLLRDPRDPSGHAVIMVASDLCTYTRDTAHCGQEVAEKGCSTHIMVYEGRDLTHWSEPRWVDVAGSIPGGASAWAPEAAWVEERQEFMVYWTTYTERDSVHPDSPYNIYYSTTKDFLSFSEPVKWIDRGSLAIDATMIRLGDWWYRAYADGRIEKTRNPYAVASKPFDRDAGPDEWAYVGAIGELGPCPVRCEGPEFFLLNEGDAPVVNGRAMPYGFMVDGLAPDQGCRLFCSADPGSSDPSDWHVLDDVDLGAMLKRHGSILPITEDEYEAVTAAYGPES
ncbi:glycoside hydrolase family 43 protein [Bifidobacterium avesanii]|uniref:1,4-beta-xylanase n=1 Tax=Bifidobacterium avesanii TaxID=1798157 RepID=A0A7K3TI31_9BIFI|nr:glycoside hydrolase family 43 protein [Bifidobacterium avesanii]KAB8290991.1 1,4-beta-xylanase [Bifidobacterium avesanii]NEG78758.1 1,4-beta-xylanase [Bifidobacterium avesanii]